MMSWCCQTVCEIVFANHALVKLIPPIILLSYSWIHRSVMWYLHQVFTDGHSVLVSLHACIHPNWKFQKKTWWKGSGETTFTILRLRNGVVFLHPPRVKEVSTSLFWNPWWRYMKPIFFRTYRIWNAQCFIQVYQKWWPRNLVFGLCSSAWIGAEVQFLPLALG